MFKCLCIHVCLWSYAKHYGKGPQRLGDQWDPCANRELKVWLWVKAHSPELLLFILTKRTMWEEALSNTGHSLSRRRRKWTIMTMTFRLILSSGSSSSATPSPDLFPVGETLQHKPTVRRPPASPPRLALPQDGLRKLSASRAREIWAMRLWSLTWQKLYQENLWIGNKCKAQRQLCFYKK